MNQTKVTAVIHCITQVLMAVAAMLGTLGYNANSKPEMIISGTLGVISAIGGAAAHYLNTPANPPTA